MSLPAKYPPQITPASWNAMVDAANGMTISGVVLQTPCSFIVRNNGGFYEAISDNGVLTYGGSGDVGGIDGTDSYDVLAECITALATNGGSIYIIGPMEIAGLDTLTHDINLYGFGEVEITTSAAGATGFSLAESASLNNIYLKENGNDPRYWYRWTTAYSELIKFTDFPSNAGVATGTPEMIWDGTINMEGAGYIANCAGIWLWDGGGAQSYCQLTAMDSNGLSIRDVGGTNYKNLTIANLYLRSGYILPGTGTTDIYIITPESVSYGVKLQAWNGAAQVTVAEAKNGVFNINNGFLGGDLSVNGKYLDYWPTAAGSAVPGGNTTGWIAVKIAGQIRYIPFYATV